MFKKALIAAAAVAAMTAATAADFKVGVVNPGRILSESAPAVAAQNKLKSYFKSREDELSRRIRTFKDKAAKFEKDSAVMTETQRLNSVRSSKNATSVLRKKAKLFCRGRTASFRISPNPRITT